MNINLTLLMQAVIFAVFIWACAKYIWPVLMRAIETRQTQIADGLAAGEEGRHALANAEKKIGEMMTEAKTRAQEIEYASIPHRESGAVDRDGITRGLNYRQCAAAPFELKSGN